VLAYWKEKQTQYKNTSQYITSSLLYDHVTEVGKISSRPIARSCDCEGRWNYFSRVVGRVLTKSDERIANKKEYRMSHAIIFIQWVAPVGEQYVTIVLQIKVSHS
jgi:hemolysin-activating ACP:hemolysin acyltransferase